MVISGSLPPPPRCISSSEHSAHSTWNLTSQLETMPWFFNIGRHEAETRLQNCINGLGFSN